MLETDAKLYEAETAVLAVLVCGIALVFLVRAIGRRKPDLDLRLLVAVAFGARALVALMLPLLGSLGDELRSDDDSLFLNEANRVAEQPLTDGVWWDTITGELNVTLYALQLKLLAGPGGTSLRIVQAAIAAAAIALIAVAVRQLGGDRRAALVAGWFLALEPSTVLFTTVLQKEALVLLGEGLVVVGLARSWTRRDLTGLLFVAPGVALTWLTRSYAGAFLLLASGLVYAHLVATGIGAERKRRPWAAAAVAAALVVGLAGAAASNSVLQRLDSLQRTDLGVNNNLQLEPVDFSTVGGLARGLPQRIVDFMFRPLPWEAENFSQALGVFTTLLTYGLYVLLVLGLFREGRAGLRRVAPLLYLAGVLVVCYALSTANSGTGFRHRIHLLVPLIGAVSILYAGRLEPVFQRVGRRLPAVACLALLALALGSCGSEDSAEAPRPTVDMRGPNTPRAAIRRYLDRVSANALPLVLAQYEPSVRERLGLERFAGIQTFSYYSLYSYDPRILSVEETGDRARALVRIGDLYRHERPFLFLLTRRDGRWRIAYDEVTETSARRYTWVNVQNRIDPGRTIGPEARRAGARVVSLYRQAALAAARGRTG